MTSNPFATLEPRHIPRVMLDANQLSAQLQKHHLMVTPELINELADSGHLPALRWKNSKQWFYLERECREWFTENWLIRQNGMPLPEVNVIVEKTVAIKDEVSLPRALHWLSPHLCEVNLGSSGVYFLLDGREVVYIGQSVAISARCLEHSRQKSKQFDRVVWLPLPKSSLDRVESALIRALKPKYNIYFGACSGEDSEQVLTEVRTSLEGK